MSANVKLYKIGDIVIHGTDQDFRKSPVEKLSVRYRDKLDRVRYHDRKTRYKKRVNPLRNRFDRMKSYCLGNKIDWRVDWRDYKRLWETAPEVFSEELGRMVPAKDYCDRKVAVDNLVLKQGSKIIWGPLK